MILPIEGNVSYTITLDPTVWIFDDRKILLEDAFSNKSKEDLGNGELKKASERWERALHPDRSRPPVNRSISKMEGKEILKNSYLMPIRDFLKTAEINEDATQGILTIEGSDDVIVSLNDLKESYLLFAIDGKPLKEDGPVYFFYKDGSNQDNPIKNVKKIIIS